MRARKRYDSRNEYANAGELLQLLYRHRRATVRCSEQVLARSQQLAPSPLCERHTPIRQVAMHSQNLQDLCGPGRFSVVELVAQRLRKGANQRHSPTHINQAAREN
jgi:hypothetical protein